MNAVLKVWSGDCCLCDVGILVDASSTFGDSVQIHTGDIVILWHGQYLGTNIENWTPSSGLTAVVSDQYQTFSDGSITVRDAEPQGYAMGIKSCGLADPEWRIQVVKKFSDVVAGEHWPEYGFSYGYSDVAEAAKAQGVAP